MNTSLPSLFCLPYAGGNINIYAKWPQCLAPVANVIPVQLPGRGVAYQQAPYTDAAELVAYLMDTVFRHVSERVILFGHSMGALITYELARALSRRHPAAVMHMIVSGYRSPDAARTKENIHALSDEEFKEELRRMNGTPQEILENRELMELVLPTLRADFKLCESYVHKPRPPLSCPITAFAGVDDADHPASAMSGWGSHTTGEFKLMTLPGDHFFIHTAGGQLLQAVYEIVHKFEGAF